MRRAEIEAESNSGHAPIAMVQAADHWHGDHVATFGRLNGTWNRSVALEAAVSSRRVVVGEERRKDALQMSLVQHDDMIQTLPASRADQPLHERILPRRPRRRDDFLDAHANQRAAKFLAVDAVAVADQIARRRIEGERFANLLADPSCCWMTRDVEMDNLAALVPQHDEAVEQLVGRSRHDKEVDRRQSSDVVLEKGAPGWRGWSAAAVMYLAMVESTKS